MIRRMQLLEPERRYTASLRLAALADRVREGLPRDKRIIPGVLAGLALLVFAWLVAGVFLGDPGVREEQQASNQASLAQEGRDSGGGPKTPAPEVENRDTDSYAEFGAPRDPFRNLFEEKGGGGNGATGNNGGRGGGNGNNSSGGNGGNGNNGGGGNSGNGGNGNNGGNGGDRGGDRGGGRDGGGNGGDFIEQEPAPGNPGTPGGPGGSPAGTSGGGSPGTDPGGGGPGQGGGGDLFNSGGDLPIP